MDIIAEAQPVAFAARRAPVDAEMTAFAQFARLFDLVHLFDQTEIHVALREHARYVFFVGNFLFVQGVYLCGAGRDEENADIICGNAAPDRPFFGEFRRDLGGRVHFEHMVGKFVKFH